MSTATFTPGPSVRRSRPLTGATALGATGRHPHPIGTALRAVKVFASAAFSVAVLGEYAEEAGVKRH
ncbi:hypothetical protein [Streptomyces sp. H27-C3]|uniref:hypothetical protein n=1 Tax=Streptomyces sp. H27-C3 TaxID=3046305 RepID=UPI0024BA6AD6|nr:hypothetical protein [Streptomyces sp. H27-C3]MDJ0464874.1 hypothetical protein [Streptomyces sp. H27-C3]